MDLYSRVGSAARLVLVCALSISSLACVNKTSIDTLSLEDASAPKVSLTHFNHLFSEVTVGQHQLGIVHIYSEYPDYSYAIEPAEGFTCVDDVARAIVMLSRNQPTTDPHVLRQLKSLVEFVLYMQNDNGYFNNFMWQDLSVNRSYKTSVATLNWWSLRALWSLQTAYPLVSDDQGLSRKMDVAIEKVVANIKRDLATTSLTTEMVNTIDTPSWLPQKYAADQGAVAMIALLQYYQNNADEQIRAIIENLAQGIMRMQKGDAKNYPYGMFLSWKNQWHSWGNNQAYALLLAGQQLNRPDYIRSALLEIDNFYPYILEQGFAEAISIERTANGSYIEASRQPFPQIAYGIRPMVFAASEAYRLTGQKKYAALSAKLTSWLFAANAAGTVMHDKKNGRTFDAINSIDTINKNSGAESTIEALLILQQQ